jgi:GT2 family glycosyltransferase
LKTLAIVVNYNSALLALKAVESVLAAESLGPVDVVVTDNSDDDEEADRLRRGLPSAVRLQVNPGNIGFGRACNQALEGFEGDAVLLINPDARLLPGCLKRLQETLFSSKRRGAVSSRLFWDEARRFYLPSSYPPPSFLYQDLLETVPPESGVAGLLSAWWRRHSIRVWGADRPIRVANLSGGMVLLKMGAVKAAGGLFDPRFFLYYEDTDLFLRMKRAGFFLVVEPRAGAVHHYDQCGQEDLARKRTLMDQSRRVFLEKHHRGWRRSAKKMIYCADRFLWHMENEAACSEFTQPFVLKTPKEIQKGWLFEVSPNPHFIPSAGCFGKGPVTAFPEACWRLLAPGRYFGRLGDPLRFKKYAQIVSWVV